MRNRKDGIAIVLVALLTVVFIGFCALLFGAGYLAMKKNELRLAGNAAALAAIREFTNSSLEARVANAEAEAWNFLHYNGGEESLADTKATYNLDLQYGRYYLAQPLAPIPDPGCGSYPCFKQVSSVTPSSEVNAIKVGISFKSGKEPFLPFIGIFGGSALGVSISSIGSAVPRCTSLIFDASASAGMETHRPFITSWGMARYQNGAIIIDPLASQPDPSAYFAYSASTVNGFIDRAWDCANPFGGASAPSDWELLERISWCATRPNRDQPDSPAPFDGSNLLPSPPWNTGVLPARLSVYSEKPEIRQRYHFRSDYQSRMTGWGWYLVDVFVDDPAVGTYDGVQPLRRILLAFNSALKTLQDQQTLQDFVQLKVVLSQVVDRYPEEYLAGSPAFTTDLDYLRQITNYENMGLTTLDNSGTKALIPLTEELPVNFLTHKMFPIAGRPEIEGGTNLVSALREAIDDLNTTCPFKEAKRQILLATDGMMTCHTFGKSPDDPQCGINYQYYLNSEAQLLGKALLEPSPALPTGEDSILDLLVSSDIALNVMLFGDYVEPNFRNILRVPKNDNHPSIYLNFLEATEHGLWDCDNAVYGCDFFDIRSNIGGGDVLGNFDTAFMNAGAPISAGSNGVYKFRRVNGVLGKMAMLSGGLWCPDQDLDPKGTYIGGEGGLLSDSDRDEGQPQIFSILNYTNAQLAANCASQAVGWNPYYLAETLDTSQSPTPAPQPTSAPVPE